MGLIIKLSILTYYGTLNALCASGFKDGPYGHSNWTIKKKTSMPKQEKATVDISDVRSSYKILKDLTC